MYWRTVYSILLLVIVVLAGCGTRPPDRAPIVLDIPTTTCELSPSGRFLELRGTNSSATEGVYAVGTWQKLPTPAPPPRLANTALIRSLWLDTDMQFFLTAVIDPQDLDSAPTDGWLLDWQHRVVTDVLALPPADRATFLAVLADRIRTRPQRAINRISPDGLYIGGDTILLNNGWPTSGAPEVIVAEAKEVVDARLCSFGWTPDSSGVYFIELTGPIGRFPGPVRYLSVEPPQ